MPPVGRLLPAARVANDRVGGGDGAVEGLDMIAIVALVVRGRQRLGNGGRCGIGQLRKGVDGL